MNQKHKLRVRMFAYTLVTTVVTGCATAYVEPTAGPTASVTFVGGAGASVGQVHTSEGDDCRNVRVMAAIGHRPALINLNPAGPVVPEKTLKIPADVPFTSQISDIRNGFAMQSCHVATRFDPKPGAEYKVIWSFGATRCEMQVQKRNKELDSWEHEPSLRAARYCWT